MDFELSEDKKMLVNTVRKFVEKECTPEFVREMDEKETFPMDLFKKMAELGFMGMPFPEEYGGVGGDIIDEVLIIEELSKSSGAFGLTYFLSTCFGGKSIEFFGTEEQKRNLLPKLISGDNLFALALTEPGGGTDILGALKTKAVRKGDHYVVNGQKCYITGAHVSDYLVTVVRTSPAGERKSGGMSVLMVDAKSPGVDIRRLKKLGIRATGTNEIFYEDVKVPVENLMGQEGKGWPQVVQTLNNERVTLAALSLGLGQAAFTLALSYAKERMAFGKPIGQFQAIQHYLAETETELEMARLLTYKAAWLQTKGIRCEKETAMAKLAASEAGFNASLKGMRILAGAGYMMEYDMQRYFRDSELFLVSPITNEMVKNFIAMAQGLPHSY